MLGSAVYTTITAWKASPREFLRSTRFAIVLATVFRAPRHGQTPLCAMVAQHRFDALMRGRRTMTAFVVNSSAMATCATGR